MLLKRSLFLVSGLLLFLAVLNLFWGISTQILPFAQLDVVLTPEELSSDRFREQVQSILTGAHQVHATNYYLNAALLGAVGGTVLGIAGRSPKR